MKKIMLAVALSMSASFAHAEVQKEVLPVVNVPISTLEAIKVQSSEPKVDETTKATSKVVNKEKGEFRHEKYEKRQKREGVDKESKMKGEHKKSERKEWRKDKKANDGEKVYSKEMKGEHKKSERKEWRKDKKAHDGEKVYSKEMKEHKKVSEDKVKEHRKMKEPKEIKVEVKQFD